MSLNNFVRLPSPPLPLKGKSKSIEFFLALNKTYMTLVDIVKYLSTTWYEKATDYSFGQD